MTIDWLFIGYLFGFITSAWIRPAVGKAYKLRSRKPEVAYE